MKMENMKIKLIKTIISIKSIIKNYNSTLMLK